MPEQMQSRLHRLIDLLRYVQSGPRFNAGQLADRYCVARRTIFRDIRLLRTSGIPIQYDEENEAYSLPSSSGFALQASASGQHLAMIVAAVMSSPMMRDQKTEAKLNEALQHIMTAFTAGARERACHVANAVAEPPMDETAAPLPAGDIWSLIVEAVAQRYKIRIEYKSASGIFQTLVAPYQIVARSAGTLIVGRSSLHREIREFNLTDILSAELTSELFETPPGTRSRLRSRADTPLQ